MGATVVERAEPVRSPSEAHRAPSRDNRLHFADCEIVGVDLMPGVVAHKGPSGRVLGQHPGRALDSIPVPTERRDRHWLFREGAHPRRLPKSMEHVDHPHGCTVADSTPPPDGGAGRHAPPVARAAAWVCREAADKPLPRSTTPRGGAQGVVGVGEKTRTSTGFLPHGPQPCASTNSATPT